MLRFLAVFGLLVCGGQAQCTCCTNGAQTPCQHANDRSCLARSSLGQCPAGTTDCCLGVSDGNSDGTGRSNIPGLKCPQDAAVTAPIFIAPAGYLMSPCFDCGGSAVFTFDRPGDLWAKTLCPSGLEDSWRVNGVTWSVPQSPQFEWHEFGPVPTQVIFSSREPHCLIQFVFVGNATPDATTFVTNCGAVPTITGLSANIPHCVAEGQITGPLVIASDRTLVSPCSNCGGAAVYTFAATAGTFWIRTLCPSAAENEWFINGVRFVVPISTSFVWQVVGTIASSQVTLSSAEPNCKISHVFFGSATPQESSTPSCVVTTTPTGPTVNIQSFNHFNGEIVNDSPIIFTFVLSEASTNFDLQDVQPRVNCLSPIFTKVTATTYTLQCNANNGLEVGVGVPPFSFTNAAGTPNRVGFNYFRVISDRVGASVFITSNSQTFSQFSSANPLIFIFTTSEPVVGFTQADLSTSNCANPSFSQLSSTQFTLSCQTTGFNQIPVSVTILANGFSDAAGNLNSAGQSITLISDVIPPTIRIHSNELPSLSVTFANPVIFTFEMSEDVGSSFTFADITTLRNCLHPVFSGSETLFHLQCDVSNGNLIEVGVGNHDFTDLAGNLNQVGFPYYAVFSMDPSLATASNTPTASLSRGASPSRSPTPTPTRSAVCTAFNYLGPIPQTYLYGCVPGDVCSSHSTLQSALSDCSARTSCGGVTLSTWSEINFGFTISPAVFQLRAGTITLGSPANEESYIKLSCASSGTDSVTALQIAGPGQSYCYSAAIANTFLPECVDAACDSFATFAQAVAFCNAHVVCAGITQTTFGPASASTPFQPRRLPIQQASPFGETSFLRQVCP
eukprot:c14490_g1_i1.p1 GENE.c14490_g1_i1~~c14490_g1_i1.p1  ORF type:complete len:846 (+),score=79.50 c14490_g1_i1:32-2569(+)